MSDITLVQKCSECGIITTKGIRRSAEAYSAIDEMLHAYHIRVDGDTEDGHVRISLLAALGNKPCNACTEKLSSYVRDKLQDIIDNWPKRIDVNAPERSR